jgi:hypothetical protein
MTAASWAQVHVGDVVRGADQRGWMVVERGGTRRWAAGGDETSFVLRLGEREVRTFRRDAAPVDVLERGDHTAESGALEALLGAGMTVEILEETTLSADPFTPPAGKTGKNEGGVRVDRWNRYILPHPETGAEVAFTRVSTVARTLADEFGLTQWKQRMVAKGMALRPDLIAGAAAADPDEDKSDLNSIAQQAMDAAESKRGANLGTAMHTFTRRLDASALKDGEVPEALRGDLVAYLDAYKAARLEVVESERIVCLPDLMVAGRFDRIVRQPAGDSKSEPLAVLDLKTGKDLSYSWLEIAIQQAMYNHAPYVWIDNAWRPMPPVDQHRALVLHLPVGAATAQLYGVNTVKGWRYAQVAMDVRGARKDAKSGGMSWLVEPDDPATVALHNVRRAESVEALAALWDQLHPRGLWSTEVNAAAATRWEEINAAVPA